jgi:dTDP-4-dehydrorhamnose 3,5-epimerase-like enzyme
MINAGLNDLPFSIAGDSFTDSRGTIKFMNSFDLSVLKRFYIISHKETSIIRAWQAHRFETKCFFAVSGSFIIAWVKPDSFLNPSVNLKAEYKILYASRPEIQVIPAGYANGIKAVEENSILLVMSDKTLAESKQDDFRFEADRWFDWKTGRQIDTESY